MILNNNISKIIDSIQKNGLSSTYKLIRYKINIILLNRSIKFNKICTNEELLRQRNTIFNKQVKISILVPLYNTKKTHLIEMIESVLNQTYKYWELCLVDASDNSFSYIEEVIKQYMINDKRIKYKKLDVNYGISENTNICLEISSGDYIALLDHDDILHPSALFEMIKEIINGADFIYTDEVTFKNNVNNVTIVNRKPDFFIDDLRAVNYICHFTSFSRELINSVGNFNSEFDGSQDYDIILRLTEKAKKIVHISKTLYWWRSHSESVASDISSKQYAIEAGCKAVKAHLERCDLKGIVLHSNIIPTVHKLEYDIIDNPLVSIIILNNNLSSLQTCISSIVNISTYYNYEIIVLVNKNDSILSYCNSLKNEKIKIYNLENENNYVTMINYAKEKTNGKYILLLNNIEKILTPKWIEEMLMYCQRKDIAIVGPKILNLNNTIYSAGIKVQEKGKMINNYQGQYRDFVGNLGELCYAHHVDLLSLKCIMISYEIFSIMFDNLNENIYKNMEVYLYDKLKEKGYVNIFTPFVEVFTG